MLFIDFFFLVVNYFFFIIKKTNFFYCLFNIKYGVQNVTLRLCYQELAISFVAFYLYIYMTII